MIKKAEENSVIWSAKRFQLAGCIVIFSIFGLGGLWAYNYEISGAVVASGELRAKSQPKLVAHQKGGVVASVVTHEGARVAKDDVLVELQSVEEKAGLAIINTQINAARAQAARLRAIRDGAEQLSFHSELIEASKNSATLFNSLVDQRAQFDASTSALREQLTQYHEREKQFARQIEANDMRIKSYATQRDFYREDLVAQESLLDDNLTLANRVNELRRQVARLEGEIAAFHADNARLRGQISEMQSAASQAIAAQQEATIGSLAEIQTRILELVERRRTVMENLKNINIVAPEDGIVQGLTVFAPGAVLGPGDTVLTLIPANDPLVIETRIGTHERDRIALNQSARVKFTAFNSRTTPELPAKISRISADRQIDEKTGASSFFIELTLDDDFDTLNKKIPKDQEDSFAPGIPAEIFITTQSRTVLSFLTKPLLDNIARAGKER